MTNKATNCYTDQTYTFTTEIIDIQTVASGVPLTSCDVLNPNGSLLATTAKGNGGLYTYEWYAGDNTTTPVKYTSDKVLNAPLGIYTAIARHPSLAMCNIASDTARVTDGRYYPPVTILQKAALSNCDPAKANGVAMATVSGGVVGYRFDWRANAVTDPTIIYVGSEAGNLLAKTYFVTATDLISTCTGSSSITIENKPVFVPAPLITTYADHTDCQTPNGALGASINLNTKDYVFKWYDGASVKNNYDALGENYNGLSEGPYTVTATDRLSGCISAPASATLQKIFEYPKFEIKTVGSGCELSDGTAELLVLENSDVATIEWDVNGSILNGAIISNIPSGTYAVTAVSSVNCSFTKEFKISLDITIYNGISRNNDGMNDYFELACIENFENNIVKIFNRAGTLVYESKGYNNGDVSFNGISNRGISLLGTDLPDGTYFYIVDKGDGSKPKTGYLELLH